MFGVLGRESPRGALDGPGRSNLAKRTGPLIQKKEHEKTAGEGGRG